jgi:hypothetical protein
VTPSAVNGVPRILLRVEGGAVLIVAVILCARIGDSWWLFAVLFLAPDLTFLGYLGGPRVGAIAYNAAHPLIGPLLLATAGLLFSGYILVPLAGSRISVSTAASVTASNMLPDSVSPISVTSDARQET